VVRIPINRSKKIISNKNQERWLIQVIKTKKEVKSSDNLDLMNNMA